MHVAEVVNATVVRVIVADSVEWPVEHLGGEWAATADPYSPEPQAVTYCGPGYVHDGAFPERFAAPWVPPTPDPETGEWSWYPRGAVHGHAGRLWRSTTDRNVWVPGESGWHPFPNIEGVLPDWIQPTGSHDTWWLGAEVAHIGKRWESLIPNNTTVPGSDPRWWRDMDAPTEPQIAAWRPFNGLPETIYPVGAVVTHTVATFPQFTVWRSKIPNNVQEPGRDGSFHRWWEPIG